MALNKQIVRMSAEGGLDTKTDEINVLSTNFLELENVVYTKTGAWSKRFGYDSYVNSVLESTDAIATGEAITTFKNELLRYSADNLYSWVPSEEKWANKGDTRFALSSEYGVATNGDRLGQPDHCTDSGLTCYAYNRTTLNTLATNLVEYRFVDAETGAVLFTGQIAGAASPQVVALQGKFFIFYWASSQVLFRTVNFSTPSVISSATVVMSASFNKFMVEKIGLRAYVVTPAATGLTTAYVNVGGTVASPVSITDASAFDFVSVAAEATSRVRYVYGNATSGDIKTVLYSADLNVQMHAPVSLAITVASGFVGSVQDPSDSEKSQIYYSVRNAPYKLYRAVINGSGTVSSNAILIYQASLQSRPQVYGDKVYFAICKDSSIIAAGPVYMPFRTVFLASEDGDLLNKYGENSTVFLTTGSPPKLLSSDDTLEFCVAEASEIQTNLSTTNVIVPTKVKKLIADFDSTNNYFDTTLGDNLHIAGGILKMYDGTEVVEHGFLETPPTLTFVSETAVGAVMPDGSYQYVAVYTWVDKWGQVHRSAPSLPYTYVVSGGPKKPTIKVQTLAFTRKDDVEIEIYRTEANGTVFYKWAYSYLDRIKNSNTVESYSFTDTTADAELISNDRAEILYTDGGVLENVSAASSKAISTYKGRVVLLGSDGYTLQYSKKRQQNGAVEFSAELIVALDGFGGPGTALIQMDDHLLIFKEQAVFALSGEGPNSLGEQDDFREPYLIVSDAGCVDPNSLVSTPSGVMYKSSKGIYLLDKSFKNSYIGAPVEQYNELTITSATLMPDTNEVRFTTGGDKALVYDYFHGKWTTFTNINAADAAVFDGNYIFIRSNGDIRQENKSSFSDNGSYIKMKLVSAWVQMAGIQGFERFYKMLLLGSYKSAHSLRVKFAYDFNPNWLHEATVNAGELLATEAYGDDGAYGVGTPYGGEFPLYQFDVRPKIQKCESFKFSIEDFKTDADGEGFVLSNLCAEVGIKTGAFKVSAARTFGAT